jgi:hypothetical protein
MAYPSVTSTNPGPNIAEQPATTASVSVALDATGAPTGVLLANNQTVPIPTAAQAGASMALPVFSTWDGTNVPAVVDALASIYNETKSSAYSGTIILTNVSGSTTTLTCDSTEQLAIGMKVWVQYNTAGQFTTGTNNTSNRVLTIPSKTTFTVGTAPAVALSSATVAAAHTLMELNIGPIHQEAGGLAGTSAFEGAIYMPNGKICLVPVGSLYIGLFDPETCTYTRGISHGEGNGLSWGAGCLGNDGIVYFAPQAVSFVGSYNPMQNKYTRKAALAGTYGGAVLVPDGRIVMIPVTPATIAIYNPLADSVATVAHGEAGGSYFSSGTVGPDGLVYMAPYGINTVGIFNPRKNTYTRGASCIADAGVAAKYEGAVVMPNGKICFIPNKATRIGIYDPVTNVWTDGPTHNISPATNAFTGGCLLADGRVLMFPRSGNYFGVYDPVTNTFIPGSYALNGSRIGAVMTPKGRVVVASGAYIGINVLDTYSEPVSAHAMALHPMYNKQ